MQEGVGEVLFPVDADQAHYLTVMTNRWRWRNPPTTPVRPPITSVPPPPTMRMVTHQHHHHASVTPPPRRTHGMPLTRCGLVVGEGEGAQLGEGQTPLGWPAPRPHFIDVKPLPPDVGAVGMGAVMREDIKVDAPRPSQDTHTNTPTDGENPHGKPEHLVEETGIDVGVGDPDGGAGAGGEEGGAGCLVVSVDSSRAASLTRTCKWSGYKKVNINNNIEPVCFVYLSADSWKFVYITIS
ncbi:hypothetical protein Hamer_G029189 [Homarus americanus]|uniref:Uncharacterized protein n=1 Tax=Homarus americanus TaxID=6706 RepID=A0A8J5K320_HOMAM|nr:hypothetical protein Hamer_G029189 [Homarus americanus]